MGKFNTETARVAASKRVALPKRERPEIEFVDAPPPNPSQHEPAFAYDEIASELHARFGEWAIIYRVPRKNQIASTWSAQMRKRGCEVVSRTQGEERIIYARAIKEVVK